MGQPEGVGAGHSTVYVHRQHNCVRGKGLQRDHAKGGVPLESVIATNQPQDKTTVLQSKLYEAAKADKARRFHALHDKLFLPYIMQRAWELVRRNKGAAGIDRLTLKDIEEYGVELFLSETAQAVRENTYRPVPVRRVHIPKPDGRLRPLGIPVVRDRVVQAAAKLVLEPIFEADFEGCSFGFRPGLGQHDALEAIAKHAQKGFRWVVDADIEQFFDNLDHEELMTALRRRIGDGAMLRLIYRWLKAGYLWEGEYHDTDEGSPQGGVLSPLLANVYLHSFDKAFTQQKSFIGHLTRYADDFVIQCGTEKDAQEALEWANTELCKLKLRIHPTKTRIVNDREAGFDFLGFHHRRVMLRSHSRTGAGRESYGVLRWPAKKAQEKFRAQVRLKLGPPGCLRPHWKDVLEGLRRYVIGWCQYFRHGQSTDVFRKLDYFVHVRVARNMARSQPKAKHRKRRLWSYYAQRLTTLRVLPRLMSIKSEAFRAYRGQAKVSWRAV
jgi:RNA-directed DNA polymerase